LILWDLELGVPLRTFRGHVDIVNGVALSPSGGLMATAGSDRTIRLWSFAEAETVAILRGHTTYVLRAVFSPGGDVLASCTLNAGQAGEVIIWGILQAEGGD
jgi:WD40 repeat protein